MKLSLRKFFKVVAWLFLLFCWAAGSAAVYAGAAAENLPPAGPIIVSVFFLLFLLSFLISGT